MMKKLLENEKEVRSKKKKIIHLSYESHLIGIKRNLYIS